MKKARLCLAFLLRIAASRLVIFRLVVGALTFPRNFPELNVFRFIDWQRGCNTNLGAAGVHLKISNQTLSENYQLFLFRNAGFCGGAN
ncbi:MAG TPA: hypothetical protein DF774_00060 [Rheinheimera sp.]|nr:hypothetical protein [Rheinheimera sp.]